MVTFHSIPVKRLIKETEDCTSIEFDVPENLIDTYRYKQGQHVTVRLMLDGEDVRRTYSVCTSPQEKKLKVAVKKVDMGRMSTYINDKLKEGDVMELMPPSGSFNTDLNPENSKNYVGFAGGSGITPIISILKSVLLTEPASTFTLVYGNRGSDSIIFKEELEGLKNKFLDRLTIYHVFSEEQLEFDLFNGFIDRQKIEGFSKGLIDFNDTDEVFICGPEPMMLQIRDALTEMGMDKKKIHIELFTSPVGKLGVRSAVKKEVDKKTIKSQITVIQDGNKYEFALITDDPILDAAMKTGADLPYACKGGVCCTCKAKLVEGEVSMDINYALEPEEVEAGFILTCQAHPKTSKVVINYDEN